MDVDANLFIFINDNKLLRLYPMCFAGLKGNKTEMWHAMCNTLIKKEMKYQNKI